MINILDKSNNVQEQITSLNVTYKRSVNIIFGHYPFPEEIHNFIIDIKNNIDPSINYSNVKGGMPDWYFFNKKNNFNKFFNYLINKNSQTHPDMWKYFFDKYFVSNAWGNEIKKGDSVGFHTHPCTHGLLFLSKGCDLIFPELNITITPEPGDYYIFPGEILHGFNKHTGDLNRYTLVFNILQGDIFKFQNKVKELNERKDI